MDIEISIPLSTQKLLVGLLEQVDLSYVGDGDSQYEITELKMDYDRFIDLRFIVRVDHLSGKFCSRQEIESEITEQLARLG